MQMDWDRVFLYLCLFFFLLHFVLVDWFLQDTNGLPYFPNLNHVDETMRVPTGRVIAGIVLLCIGILMLIATMGKNRRAAPDKIVLVIGLGIQAGFALYALITYQMQIDTLWTFTRASRSDPQEIAQAVKAYPLARKRTQTAFHITGWANRILFPLVLCMMHIINGKK